MAGIKDAKCVLVIGATAGIGRALALAIHDLDSKPIVIVAGRRQERLDELAAKSDRIKTARVDINTSYDKLKPFVELTKSFASQTVIEQVSLSTFSLNGRVDWVPWLLFFWYR